MGMGQSFFSMAKNQPRIQHTADKLKAILQHGVQRGVQMRQSGQHSAGEILRLGTGGFSPCWSQP